MADNTAMRLKYQIFLTLLLASALLIALMYAISSWRFSRGFLDYVNQNEIARLEPLSEQLIARYEDAGGTWDWVNDKSMREYRFDSKNRKSGKRSQNNSKNTNADKWPPPPSGDGFRQDHRGPPLMLTDAEKQTLFGKLNTNQSLQWLPLDNGNKLIGYLAFTPRRTVDRQFDQVFAAKQKKTLGLTALAMIFFSGLLSIPLATRIVRPLLRVNQAVDEISGGNYDHRLNIRRNDELGDLANNVNTLGATLEQNRSARQRWIAEISHELRTPLAILRGEMEAVQDGVRKLDQSGLDSLHGEVLHLSRLVDDLHTLSMSDVGALDYQMDTINTVTLLSNFFKANSSKLDEHAITLQLSTGDFSSTEATFVQGDAQRLEQLLSNLLQNTCRYTDRGGKLIVECKPVDNNIDGHTTHVVLIDWLDSTPGIDAKFIPSLFEPFYRGEQSRNRATGGSGLGLAIAKRIVEAHRGSISASESALGGLHIQIRLPFLVNNA